MSPGRNKHVVPNDVGATRVITQLKLHCTLCTNDNIIRSI